MNSFTVTFTGTKSILQADFLPEITLDPDSEYCCGLLDFSSYNSIPNIVDGKNNKFSFKSGADKKEKTISFSTGAYECSDILNYITSQLQTHKIKLTHEINVATSKVKLTFDTAIECTDESVLRVLGFAKEDQPIKFVAKEPKWSNSLVKITDIDIIRIQCDQTHGAFLNGVECNDIYQFSNCRVLVGHKFIESVQHIIYYPIKNRRLRSIQISIVDQNGQLIDFRGEQISVRIHIKKVDNTAIN